MIIVSENEEGQRIDNFLFKRLKGVPKSHIYRILRTGAVRVNKKRVRPQYKLQLCDQIQLPQLRVATREKQKPGSRIMQLLNARILYEDKEMLIVNKPSGFAAHGDSGVDFGVIETLRAMRPEVRFLELAHRLDRETSGCLLLAKKRSLLKELHLLLQQGKIRKTYLALLRGRWQGGKRKVDAPLLKNQLKSGERLVRVSDMGKAALTEFKPLQKFSAATLMEVILYTGRTHQIRVHAAYLGCPIAGDGKYGDKKFNKDMRKIGLNRLFLHACALKFRLPSTGRVIIVRADLDEELLGVLQRLK